jgi:hypothetical protein
MRPTKKCCTWTEFLFWRHWLTSTQTHSNLPPWKGIHKWPCTHCFSNARHPSLPQLHSHSRIEANSYLKNTMKPIPMPSKIPKVVAHHYGVSNG